MPLTEKGQKILNSMEQTYGDPDKAKEVLYASKNAGTISGIDTADEAGASYRGEGVFGTANPVDCGDALPAGAPPMTATGCDEESEIGADPGLPEPELNHPQQYPGESTPPEPALPSGDAFVGDINGEITGGAIRQDWGEGSTWPNVGDAIPGQMSIMDICRENEGWWGPDWTARPLGPDAK
jgi:hypothetical protein